MVCPGGLRASDFDLGKIEVVPFRVPWSVAFGKPTPGASIHIAKNAHVIYDLEDKDVSESVVLKDVSVAGVLEFDPKKSVKMIVDTLVVLEGSYLNHYLLRQP
jgi:hypothetical protein